MASLTSARSFVETALAELHEIHDRSGRAIAALSGQDVHAVHQTVSPPVVQVPTETIQVQPDAAPPRPVPSAAVPPASPPLRAENILMTCFANREDEGRETPAGPNDPPKRTALGIPIHYQDGMRIIGIALPWKVRPGRLFRITLKSTGVTVDKVHQVDEGPWETHDAWLEEGRRPHAEALKGKHVSWSKVDGRWIEDPTSSRIENGAGVDGLPLLWALLLNKPVEEIYNASPSGLVTIEEYDADTTAADAVTTPSAAPASAHTPGRLTLADVASRARLGLPLAVDYEIATGGQSGTAPLPGTLLKSGVRQSDCSGFGDWCEGVSRDETGWNTDYAYNDARGVRKHYKPVAKGQARPGHKLVVPKRPGHEYGHEGVVSHVTNGVPDRVLHCSSMNPAGHAIAETDTIWFEKNGALVVEYLGLIPG